MQHPAPVLKGSLYVLGLLEAIGLGLSLLSMLFLFNETASAWFSSRKAIAVQEASRHSPRPSPPHAWEPLSERGGLASPVWPALPPWARHPAGCDGSQCTRPCWCPGWGVSPVPAGARPLWPGSCPEEPSGAVCRGPPSMHSTGGSDGVTPDSLSSPHRRARLLTPSRLCSSVHLCLHTCWGPWGLQKISPCGLCSSNPLPLPGSHKTRVLGEGWPKRSLGRWGWQGRGHRRTGHDRAGSLAPPRVCCCPPHGQTGGSGVGSRAPPRVAGPSPCRLPGAGPQRSAAHCVPGVRVLQGAGGVRSEPQLLRVPGGPL